MQALFLKSKWVNVMASYPIIEQTSLPKAERTGLWGLGGRSRDAAQLPRPKAHEAVVYKSGGSYVVDDGRSRLNDDHVVNVTNVSVVDMSVDTPVTVQTSIPSAGAAEFTVQVTFLCTVRKPEDVVDAGLREMQEPLLQYLVRHQPLFHIGEEHEFTDINTVRRNVTAEIRAYVSVRPPRFRGIEVTLGNVQVLTPDELAKFESIRRERLRQGILTAEDQRQAHSLARENLDQQQIMDVSKQQYSHELRARAEVQNQELSEMRRQLAELQELQKRRHEQLLEEVRLEFEHDQERRQRSHDQGLRSETLHHAIDEAAKLQNAIGAEQSDVPTLLAATAGEHSLSQTAELLNRERQREREAQAADDARRREDSLRLEAREWDERREQWRAERADAAEQRQADRDERQIRYNLRLQEIRARLEVVQAGINRGLADDRNIEHIERVVARVVKELEHAATAVGASASNPREDVSSDGSDEIDDSNVHDAEVIQDPDAVGAADAGGTAEPTREAQMGSASLGLRTDSPKSAESIAREEDLGL